MKGEGQVVLEPEGDVESPNENLFALTVSKRHGRPVFDDGCICTDRSSGQRT
jgi:hypothetical protein